MKPQDPNHPYVRRLVGCGHGVLFTDHCDDCEVVELLDQYKRAVRTLMFIRNELRRRGIPLPGNAIVE